MSTNASEYLHLPAIGVPGGAWNPLDSPVPDKTGRFHLPNADLGGLLELNLVDRALSEEAPTSAETAPLTRSAESIFLAEHGTDLHESGFLADHSVALDVSDFMMSGRQQEEGPSADHLGSWELDDPENEFSSAADPSTEGVRDNNPLTRGGRHARN